MTDTRKVPRAPSDLSPQGRAFWRTTVTTFELSEVELELLRECSRLLDECEQLRSTVDGRQRRADREGVDGSDADAPDLD